MTLLTQNINHYRSTEETNKTKYSYKATQITIYVAFDLKCEIKIAYIIGGIDLKNSKDNGLSKYLVMGMIIGLFVGVVFSIIMRNNTFFAISGPGFGVSFGIIIAAIIWGLKK